MGIIRPATPGFLVTLVATILLAVVSFSVPLLKSIYFLKASFNVQNVNGTVTFGTLGYCIEIGTSTTCSNPTIGYELDINKLVGNDLPIQIPQVVIKWLTYALVLHIVALALSGGSAVFGLLAHVREMSMTCCSTCVSGFAAAVAALAFIFDAALFYVAKARIDKVQGGSGVIGNGVWLTLAATVLLFFSGCFYTLGRCCIKRRPRGEKWDKRANGSEAPIGFGSGSGYAEQLRLDAVKAEADRKAKQMQGETGLPSFQEYEPLKAKVTDEGVYLDDEPRVPYHDAGRPSQSANEYIGGYARAPPGTRTVDDYYSPTESRPGVYPPQPQRQASTHTQSSAYPYSSTSTTPPLPTSNNYLSTVPQYGHEQRDTSYHSAISHQQYPTDNSYDPYQSQTTPSHNYYTQSPPPPHADNLYTQSAPIPHPGNYYTQSPPIPPANSYYPASPPPHERSYTLGGDGYGDNILPAPQGQPAYSQYTSPINTNVSPVLGHTSPVRGPRSPRLLSSPYEDNPPVYDSGTSHATPSGWSSKN